jgi:hypothetical protein
MKKARIMLGTLMLMAVVGGLFAFNVKNGTTYFSYDALRGNGLKCFAITGFTTNILQADDPTPITLSTTSASSGNTCEGAITLYPKAD